MSKKQKLMKSMEFRENLASALEEVRLNEVEIIILHYKKPVAKLIKFTELK
jgi:hypothetical protein